MDNSLTFKVDEASQEDINGGIVRIDSTYMHRLGVKAGDVVEIIGERTTVAIVERALPIDIGLNKIRMEGMIRRNARAGLGEKVIVRKADVVKAKKIVIAPQTKDLVVKASPIIFQRGLLGKAMVKGDLVSLGGRKYRHINSSQNQWNDELSRALDHAFSNLGYGNFNSSKLIFVVTETNPKKPVIITRETEVEFNPDASVVDEEKILEVTYEDIGGLVEEIKKVREMVELPLKHPELFEALGIEPPKGLLLHGPPGTGKTLLAKAVANETNANFISINGPEIMSKYYGQSEENLRKKFEEAEKDAPSIIFIDEIDAIASKREESRGEVERRVVAQMLTLMDGLKTRGKIIVIGATNIHNDLDPALRRPGRFDREIEIGAPDKDGRHKILRIHTRNMPLTKNVNLKKIAEITHGFVGADLASLAKEAAMILLRENYPELRYKEGESIPKEDLEKLKIRKKDFIEALKVVRPSALREVLVEIPNIKWKNIGGLEKIKQELIEAVEWPLQQPEIFGTMGIKPPKGILLYGPPGTGKTLLAKAVANESKANFILIKGPELLSKFVGESEKAVRKIFKKARQTSPTIIFFDEIDSISPKRSLFGSDNNVTERVVTQLLTEIDGMVDLHNIVIIGATNRPARVDTALLRPGRFDRILYVSSPGLKGREEIFKIHTKNMPITKTVDLKKLAKKTEGYVGADIESLCREAAILELRKDMKAKSITMKSFETALTKVLPSTSKIIEKKYENFLTSFRTARSGGIVQDKNKPVYYG